MPNVDLDDEFLKLFFGINNKKAPEPLSLRDIKKQLIDVVDIIKELNKSAQKPIKSDVLGNNTTSDEKEEEENNDELGPAILVVDDLGVITYQLKVLLSCFNMDVDCSQEIYDAVNKYKKRNYQYVVMDLFIPTEREGFILLTELKKLAQASNVETVIGVITASPRKEIEQQCRLRGADFFLEKNNEWQTTLLNTMKEYINTGKDPEDEL